MFGDIIFSSIAAFKIWTDILMLKILLDNAFAGYTALI